MKVNCRLLFVLFVLFLWGCGGRTTDGGSNGIGPITDLVVRPLESTPPSIAVGFSVQLQAIGQDDNGNEVDLTQKVNWKSASEHMAVNGHGLVTALSEGAGEVFASYGALQSNRLAFESVAAQLRSIFVSPEVIELPVGLSVKVGAVGWFSDGMSRDISSDVTWELSAPIGSISNAVLSATKLGHATLTAKSAEVTSNDVDVSVVESTIIGVRLESASTVLPVGGSTSLRAVAFTDTGLSYDVTRLATWSVVDPSVISVTSDGMAIGKRAGTTTVGVRFRDVSDDGSFVVGADSSILKNIYVSGVSSIVSGVVTPVRAIGIYDDGSSRDITRLVRWKSDDVSIAMFLPGGRLKGGRSGNVNISAELSGVSGVQAVEVTDAVVSRLVIEPGEFSLAAGYEQQLTVWAQMSNGSELDVTNQVFWRTESDVATVSANGLVRANRAGVARISAALAGVEGTTTLTVTGATLERVVVNGVGAQPVLVDEVVKLSAMGVFSDGSSADVTRLVRWSVDAPGVAQVTPDGRLVGFGAGDVRVTARVGTVVGSQVATITSARLVDIDVSVNSGVPAGLAMSVSASGLYSDGSSRDITRLVHWASSDPSVARFLPDGRLMGVKPGSVAVTASLSGISGGLNAVVSDAVLKSVLVLPVTLSLPVGYEQQLTAWAQMSDGSQQDVTDQVLWRSDNGFVTVSVAGAVRANAVGVSRITANLTGVVGESTVTVTSAVLESITISGGDTLPAGYSAPLSAVGRFSDGSSADVSRLTRWSVDAPDIAQVGPDGRLIGLQRGEVIVTANAGGRTGTQKVTITNGVLESITILGAAPLPAGDSERLSAIGLFSDGKSSDISRTVRWSSANLGVAIVAPTGVMTGVRAGGVKISASVMGVTGYLDVSITSARLVGITIEGPDGVPQGLSSTFKAIGQYSDNSSRDITRWVKWSTSDTTVAIAAPNGLVTGSKEGAVEIRVAHPSGVTGKQEVTITSAVVRSIRVNPIENSIPVGTYADATATAVLSSGETYDVTPLVLWQSDSDNARVSPSGRVFGVRLGTAHITASFNGVVGRSGAWTMTDALLEEITIPSSTLDALPAGGNRGLEALGRFSDGSVRSIARAVQWSVEAGTGRAVITPDGTIVGTQAGEVTVVASANGLEGRASLRISDAVLTSLTLSRAGGGAPPLAPYQYETLTLVGHYSDSSSLPMLTLPADGVVNTFNPTVIMWSDETSLQVKSTDVGDGIVSVSIGSIESNRVTIHVVQKGVNSFFWSSGIQVLSKQHLFVRGESADTTGSIFLKNATAGAPLSSVLNTDYTLVQREFASDYYRDGAVQYALGSIPFDSTPGGSVSFASIYLGDSLYLNGIRLYDFDRDMYGGATANLNRLFLYVRGVIWNGMYILVPYSPSGDLVSPEVASNYTHSSARSLCENTDISFLNTGGQRFRLPTQAELKSFSVATVKGQAFYKFYGFDIGGGAKRDMVWSGDTNIACFLDPANHSICADPSGAGGARRAGVICTAPYRP